METLEKAQKMLEKYPLCDHCLGRQFAFLGYGMDNQERGRVLKTVLTMEAHLAALEKNKKDITILKTLATNGAFPMATEILRKLKRKAEKEKKCLLCKGRFEALPALVEKAVGMLKDYEYDTFLVGVKLPTEIEEREDEFKAEFEVQYGESIKNEFSRTAGKMLAQATGKTVEYMKPQLVVLVNPFTEDFRIQANSLFIMGRYRKLVRNISQSKWVCRACGGKGCPKCQGTGKMYPESVEELITGPVMKRNLGDESLFHGAGREDADARMLGRGRPFVVEIRKPHKRTVDLLGLERDINEAAQGKIEVKGLKIVDREMVRKIKDVESAKKVYRVVVRFGREVSDEEIGKLEDALTGVTIFQQTPTRVIHRRADRTREKQIYETKVKRLSQNSIEMKVQCQGGLYIKELVTGDNGRTEPNVSKIVGAKAEPLELDVMNVLTKGGKL
jgi:tRNA pseudouridine synthase 10